MALVVGLTCCSRKAQQPSNVSANKPSAGSALTKDIWVSETTGKDYRVTIDKDIFRAEWVNISPDSAQHGAFIRSECKRQGSKWVGVSKSFIPCTVESGAHPKIDNWCHLETNFEIDTISPTAITGQGEAFEQFDCMKCKILKSEMKEFSWSPKQIKQ